MLINSHKYQHQKQLRYVPSMYSKVDTPHTLALKQCLGESSKFPQILNFKNSNLITYSMPTEY